MKSPGFILRRCDSRSMSFSNNIGEVVLQQLPQFKQSIFLKAWLCNFSNCSSRSLGGLCLSFFSVALMTFPCLKTNFLNSDGCGTTMGVATGFWCLNGLLIAERSMVVFVNQLQHNLHVFGIGRFQYQIGAIGGLDL